MVTAGLWVFWCLNDFLELRFFHCNQVTGLELIFFFWTASGHPLSAKASRCAAERSDGRNGEQLL